MHHSARVQILQERQLSKLDGMMIATNRLQIEAQIRNEEPPKTVTGMAHFLREIALGLPRYQPKPFSQRSPEEAKGRPDAAEALRVDGIRIPCNESLADKAVKTQAPRAA